ncbi:uncharacterized protein LOC141680640 [Apium graveolens]|uniref:uncharacterized protein LOC141680640 n=1 Tax=Apium graveolens TaxID=4045 RepID=UPI003D79F7C6
MVNQWIDATDAKVPLIEIDVDTLEDGEAVMEFYKKVVMLVCGKLQVDNINVMEFSEYPGYNFPHQAAQKGYFVRFTKKLDSITILLMSGNLFLESFQINKGIVYILSNDQVTFYEENIQAYNTLKNEYDERKKFYDVEYEKALQAHIQKKAKKFIKPSMAGLPKEPRKPPYPNVYKCLDHYGLKYIPLGIGSSYPILQKRALKNRNEMLFGKKSLDRLFDKLLNFEPSDKQKGAEFGLFGAVFVSESVRLLVQASEMARFFREKIDGTISVRNWKLHLAWSFVSKILRLKKDEEAKGTQRSKRYSILVDGIYLDENQLEEMYWTLKNGDTDVKLDDEYLTDNVYDLDKKSSELH